MFRMYDKFFISVTSHALDPLPCHKLSHLLGPPPSCMTYFMDGPIITMLHIGLSYQSAYLSNCPRPLLVGIDERDRFVGILSDSQRACVSRSICFLSGHCPRPHYVSIDQRGPCVGRGVALFETMTFNRRVVGSTPALAAT